jgi:acyl carrier protein phosphodiesterase
MNFLSHYFLDRGHPSSLFAIGAATPDLLSIYNERLRIKKHHLKGLDGTVLSESAVTFALGVSRHFQADDAFHSSDFFATQTAWISDELERHFVTKTNQRKFFLAHVLLELIMDKILINNNKGIIDEYYGHFAVANPFRDVQEFTETISKHPLPNYDHFLDKFLQNRYLVHYSEWDHIIYVLKRILRRASVADPAFLDDPRFVDFLNAVQKGIEKRHLEAFEEVHQTMAKSGK